MKKLKIAIITDWLVKIGGAEIVLKDIIDAFEGHDITLITSVYNKNLKEFKEHKKILTFLNKIPFSSKIYKLLFGLMPYTFRNINLDEFDIAINSNWALSKCIKTNVNTFHIGYVHNPTRYLWCDSKNYFLSSGPKWIYTLLKPILHQLRQIDFINAKNFDYIVCNSKTVQKRIKKYYRLDSKVLNPASHTIFKPQKKLDEEYYVSLGRLKGFKRFDLTIKAFNKNKKNLVIIGEGEEENQLKKLANKNIKFLGRVSDQTRDKYLQNAKALIFPQEEDFGITIIDALRNKIPVIAFKKGGAKEIINKDCGIFFEKQTVGAINIAINEFETMRFDKEKIYEKSLKYDKKNFQENFKKIVLSEYEKYKEKYID